MIKQLAAVSRNSRAFSAAVLGCLLLMPAVAWAAQGVWEAWSSETFTLDARESFQFHVTFDQLPVRSWKLVVDGGEKNCDLSVLRVRGESLLYYKTDESRHELLIPWGRDEELIVVMTNRKRPGTFVVTLWGPPKGQAHAAYSYHVNRALEAFASGRRLDAEDHCEKALRKDANDGVAMVLLAGFLRDRNFYSRAGALVKQAQECELPGDMLSLAQNLEAELKILRAPLPSAVRKDVARIEGSLDRGSGQEALDLCLGLIAGHPDLPNQAKSRLQMLQGRALDQIGRDFEAVDAFTRALGLSRNRGEEAVIYFHMGRLFLNMDNPAQAQGAYTFALQHGLPSALEELAREDLQVIERHLDADR